MKIVITNDFTVMLSMMGEKPFLTVDVREGKTSEEGSYLTASVFPSGQIYFAQIDGEQSDANIKSLLESIVTTSEDGVLFNIILDMQTLSSETHKRVSSILSSEFTGVDTTVFMTENEEDKCKSSYVDEYAESIYNAFIEGLNCGATLINLPDADLFIEKKTLVLDEKFVPRFVPGFLSCFLILGARDFSPQLYRMIKKVDNKVYFDWEMSFEEYIGGTTNMKEDDIDDSIE